MAQRIRIVLEDDLTGEVLDEGRGETIRFALDGHAYEIDLSGENARAMRDALRPFMRAGRRLGRDGRTSARTRR